MTTARERPKRFVAALPLAVSAFFAAPSGSNRTEASFDRFGGTSVGTFLSEFRSKVGEKSNRRMMTMSDNAYNPREGRHYADHIHWYLRLIATSPNAEILFRP
jgi:hypothetical protein